MMANRLATLQKLKELYTLKGLGECYIEHQVLQSKISCSNDIDIKNKILHCKLCARSKMGEAVFGNIQQNAKVIFATLLPVMNSKGQFLPIRSVKILQDIIKNVFCFAPSQYSVLSLLKCADTPIKSEEFDCCKPYFFEQINLSMQGVILCFGGNEALEFFELNKNCFGKIINFRGRRLLVTYSLGELLKNPSLKKEAMRHFVLLKEVL